MLCYASRTGTKRNLEILRRSGWRLMVSAMGQLRHEGFPYALDNGAWTAYQRGTSFDGDAFLRAVDILGRDADFVVCPDIVGGGLSSLSFSLRWSERLSGLPLLLPTQDGMAEEDVAQVTGSFKGLFLGGTTEWKEATMASWGRFCSKNRLWYHIGRVNTIRRLRRAWECNAQSVDGSGASKWCKQCALLNSERERQRVQRPFQFLRDDPTPEIRLLSGARVLTGGRLEVGN